ncbi:SusD/RagB family nutrient-binding outer membrane lipoprotein [Flagellimonas oceanensis]|uniref:SusD/RagB family nutrient-binding outer membrane lipoprotein n=1 Tax=Flagellimonas oceanensis TaxID=2499163 RepID=UPI003BAB0352
MMKLKNIKQLLVTIISISILSCDDADFGSMNIDPNNPSDPSTASLLTSAQVSLSGYTTATTPNLYVQYLSNGQYPEESQYSTVNFDYGASYTNILVVLDRVIELNSNEDTMVAASSNGSNDNQIAVAKILTAYTYQLMTDRWGMLPYTEALQGLDDIFATYDSQEVIYDGLFTEIDEALALIENGQPGPTGDIILGGNMARWRQFANTLKMNMAIRVSKRFPNAGGYAATKFNEAISGAITSNGENLYYTFLAEENNDNPWEDRFLAPNYRLDYLLSDTFVGFLVGSGTPSAPEDPRLAEYAVPAEISGTFVGAPYGEENGNTPDYSFITPDVIYNQEAPGYMFTYAQVAFAQAEAVELGWIPGSAASYYEEGIMASMEQWGVDPADATAYIAANPYTGIEDIAYEKYVALYLQGYEAWAEWRRFGDDAPSLSAPATALSGNGIPQRQAYATNASASNEENYNAAVSQQGPDNLDTVLWWAQ